MEEGTHRRHAKIHASAALGVFRCFRPMWYNCTSQLQHIFDYSVQVGGPLYILLAITLISCVIYLFFSAILPAIHQFYSIRWMLHTAIASWLTFNVFFNYYNCACTDPGSPIIADMAPDFAISGKHESFELKSSGMMRWCKRCRRPKPQFTHHCHICKRCILKMDHHCPWMHNCIGYFNYRYFFVFLLYLWAGCGYAMYMASLLLFAENDQEDSRVLFTFILALAVFGSLSCLLGWHMYLIMSAQTTIEFHTNRRHQKEAMLRGETWVNDFDLGALHNFQALFDRGGPYWWWLIMLLPIKYPPKGDGMHFVSRHISFQLSRVSEPPHIAFINSRSTSVPNEVESTRDYTCKEQTPSIHLSFSSGDIV